jgi:hypothetical protein
LDCVFSHISISKKEDSVDNYIELLKIIQFKKLILSYENFGSKKQRKEKKNEQSAHAIKTPYRQGLRVCDTWF